MHCFGFSSRNMTQFIGDLPHERVSSSPPFSNVGIDFAGQLFYKNGSTKKMLLGGFYLLIIKSCAPRLR